MRGCVNQHRVAGWQQLVGCSRHLPPGCDTCKPLRHCAMVLLKSLAAFIAYLTQGLSCRRLNSNCCYDFVVAVLVWVWVWKRSAFFWRWPPHASGSTPRREPGGYSDTPTHYAVCIPPLHTVLPSVRSPPPASLLNRPVSGATTQWHHRRRWKCEKKRGEEGEEERGGQ